MEGIAEIIYIGVTSLEGDLCRYAPLRKRTIPQRGLGQIALALRSRPQNYMKKINGKDFGDSCQGDTFEGLKSLLKNIIVL
jgi:hypothetical protein